MHRTWLKSQMVLDMNCQCTGLQKIYISHRIALGTLLYDNRMKYPHTKLFTKKCEHRITKLLSKDPPYHLIHNPRKSIIIQRR